MIKRKHISFLLLLSFSILLSHNLVPHHHHAEILESAIDDDCPVEHNDHHCDEEAPVHCHAFNDLSFYNIGGQYVLQQVRIIYDAEILIAELVNEDPNTFVTGRILNFEVPPSLPGNFSSLTTRGPPVFA